jgi:hypothetical protein
MVADAHRPRGRGSSVGLRDRAPGRGAVRDELFLLYYAFPGGQSVSLYDQLLVAQGGGLELGAKLFLFGGVAASWSSPSSVSCEASANRRAASSRARSQRGHWTWIGSLLQTASLREGAIPRGLFIGFWLQAVSIGVAVIGTILVVMAGRGEKRVCSPALDQAREHRSFRSNGVEDDTEVRCPHLEVRRRNVPS